MSVAVRDRFDEPVNVFVLLFIFNGRPRSSPAAITCRIASDILLLRGRVRVVEPLRSTTVSGTSPSMLMGYGREAVEALEVSTLAGSFYCLNH